MLVSRCVLTTGKQAFLYSRHRYDLMNYTEVKVI